MRYTRTKCQNEGCDVIGLKGSDIWFERWKRVRIEDLDKSLDICSNKCLNKIKIRFSNNDIIVRSNVRNIPDDKIYTPDHIVDEMLEVIDYSGTILEPCRGSGNIYNKLPRGSLWCEIDEGIDFFDFNKHVDWIITNPPYSIFKEFLKKALRVADNIAFLIPVVKVYASIPCLSLIYSFGGIKQVHYIGSGRNANFRIGFPIGIVIIEKHFRGKTLVTFSDLCKSKFQNENMFQSVITDKEDGIMRRKAIKKSKQINSDIGIFDSANKGRPVPKLPNMKKGFHEVVQNIFDSGYNVEKEFREIEESLSIKNALTPGVIQSSANNVEEMARRAFRLYVIAKSEYEAYIRETDAIVGGMREGATAILEKEKVNKIRTKQITEADVKEYAAQNYPDEWEDINNRRDRSKGMLAYIENLSSLAKSRCYTVSNMLNPGSKLKL
jgi:hypothetical protein